MADLFISMSETTEKLGDTFMSYFQGEYATIFAVLFLSLYGAMAAPKLPATVAQLFESPAFRFFLMLMIAYNASRGNFTVAILSVTIFVFAMQRLDRLKIGSWLRGAGIEFFDGSQMWDRPVDQILNRVGYPSRTTPGGTPCVMSYKPNVPYSAMSQGPDRDQPDVILPGGQLPGGLQIIPMFSRKWKTMK